MQLAIFDLDGTLTQTTRVDAECFVRAFADEFGVVVDPSWAAYTHSTDTGISLEIFQRQVGREPSADELARLQRRFVTLLERAFAADANRCAETTGARVALQRLRRERNWTAAIATGSWQACAALKLRTAGFDVGDISAAFADDGIPRDDIMRAALARSRDRQGGAVFSRVVSIGDAVWDVRTAQRLALPFVGIGGLRRAAALRAAGASHVISDFTDYDGFLTILGEARVPS